MARRSSPLSLFREGFLCVMTWPPWRGTWWRNFRQIHRTLTLCGLMLWPVAGQCLKTAQVYRILVLWSTYIVQRDLQALFLLGVVNDTTYLEFLWTIFYLCHMLSERNAGGRFEPHGMWRSIVMFPMLLSLMASMHKLMLWFSGTTIHVAGFLFSGVWKVHSV